MDPEAQRRAEALDRYWDEVVAGRSTPPPTTVSPAAVTVLRSLRLLATEAGFADRPRDARRPRHAMNATTEDDMSAMTFPPVERAPRDPGERDGPQGGWRGMLFGSGWSAAQAATAALVLLTLAGGLVAFGPASPIRHPGGPVAAPSIAGAPATPAPGAAPAVEFLWGTAGDPSMLLREPGPLAIGPAGSLWIPDGVYDRFLIFASNGSFLDAWGTPGGGAGEFEFSDVVYGGIGFGQVAFDGAGNLYVADTGNHRIQKFGPDRAFITAWGEEGPGAGQFRRLTGIAVDRQGRVYASDGAWGKIEVFDADGTWIETWSGLESPAGLAIEADGSVLVADVGAGVLRFSPDGERLATLTRYGSRYGEFVAPTGVAVDGRGRIFVADMDANRVLVLSPDGTVLGGWGARGDGPGEFHYPTGIAVGADGVVYVNDEAGDRLQAFRLLPPLAAEASPTP